MSYTGTLYQYIQTVERTFKNSQGIALSRLLSLRDDHVGNKNLRSSDIASLVEGNCSPLLDEILIAHLLCVKVVASLPTQIPERKIPFREFESRFLYLFYLGTFRPNFYIITGSSVKHFAGVTHERLCRSL